MGDVIRNESRNEKVAVIVPRLTAELEGKTRRGARLLQKLGTKLAFQEFVGRALVD